MERARATDVPEDQPDMPQPELVWIAQDRPGPVEHDPAGATRRSLTALDLGGRVGVGQSVAVGVGSRGIADLAVVVRATIDHLRGLGLAPFIVPAMGSHGGGTATGQRAVLAGYGITEAAMGCPIRATMDAVEIATSALGFPIWFDRFAAGADHVVVVNRVKPHTVLEGPIESGLTKMLLVGLGKQTGAQTYHRSVFDHAWPTIVEEAAPRVGAAVSVLAGVAIVENGQDRTAEIRALPGADFVRDEPALLARAASLLPRLPFDDIDILLVDRIGKDVSGSGLDTNVVGRKGAPHHVDPDRVPRVRTIVVRGLTPATAGNAMGIGLAELCRTRVVEGMDTEATWLNASTSGNLAAGMVPMHRPSDRELLALCATRTGLRDRARIVWIRDTRSLGVVAASTAFLDEIAGRDDLTVQRGPEPMPLDGHGNLPDLLPLA